MLKYNLLSDYLKNSKIKENENNYYLFLMFFLERCQFISNLILVIDKERKDSFLLGMKYNIMYIQNFETIENKIIEFRKEFDKEDLINEILNFIKNSFVKGKQNSVEIEKEKKVDKNEIGKPLIALSKMKKFLLDFDNLDEFIREIDDCTFLDGEEVYRVLLKSDTLLDKDVINENNCIKLQRSITRIELDWISFKRDKNHPNQKLYQFLGSWFDF